MTLRAWLRWALLAVPIFILIAASIYMLALRSRAYASARQFLLTSETIRQELGTVRHEVMLTWTIRTHRKHEAQSTSGGAVFSVVLFGSRAFGLASLSLAMKDDRWSVTACELRRSGHPAERISN